MIEFDHSEVQKLRANLSAVGPRVAVNARKAVEVTARRVKDSARDRTRGMKYLGGVPAAIDYDMLGSLDGIRAEVGFNKRGQGKLGNIIEYGSRYFPARGQLTAALYDNEADFVKGIMQAVDESMDL
ncbi:hypothetical protein [Gulosibacter faecalis]|uniref:HK97 gp10 family phage protein n=1 Tax=Gulosibacter faecalis TaxID=272240 RepID=A0ABW5UXJ3_9MICO|nr:hypothetical protein [Gulosibacter faecalis]